VSEHLRGIFGSMIHGIYGKRTQHLQAFLASQMEDA
jgi:hypothetical protein